MRIILKTQVNQSLPTVWSGFNRGLFEKLAPLFPPVKVVRFDGCQTNDVVQLRLNFWLFHQDWTSLIVDQQTTANEIYFIDEGTQLPFFLSYWRHRHRLCRYTDAEVKNEQTIIIDDITFRTPFLVTDYFVYPVLWVQFACRKFVYRRSFNKAQ